LSDYVVSDLNIHHASQRNPYTYFIMIILTAINSIYTKIAQSRQDLLFVISFEWMLLVFFWVSLA